MRRQQCAATMLLATVALFHAAVPAQQPDEAPAAATPAPAPKRPDPPKGTEARKEPAPSRMEPLEITEKRSTTGERRDSTASKIVIGREEIEQYGDTNLGDVMRRLPGVTQGGRPGRGGPVRMRGMAGGYTQILVDGERIPPGFSIEDITPEQVERIEILRAPTAETGTRAIAGTINIILREALRERRNDIRIGVQEENGRHSPNASYSRNDALSETGSYNFTLSVNRRDLANDGVTETTFVDVPTDTVTLAQRNVIASSSLNESLFMTSRFQWRLGPGEQFSFQPFVVASNNASESRGKLTQSVGATPAPYDTSASRSDSQFRNARFTTLLNQRLDAQTTYELRGGARIFTVNSFTLQDQFDAGGNRTLRQTTENDIRDASWNAVGKVARRWAETHTFTTGGEWEQGTRKEQPLTLQNGEPQLEEFGTDIDVKVRRAALYLQDEWDPNPNWSTSLGVRWEAIETRSATVASPVDNRSSVVNPLAHVVWRFDAPRRDQLRASLTQSYRPPTTQNLVARPRLNTLYPVPGPNTPTSADAAGNASLKPEIANGVELAYESYLSANGVLSANVFTRRLTDVIRTVTAQEQVSWATSPRWVARPQNLGRATTSGIELDAKFGLRELFAEAAPVNVRANFSAFRSRVEEIPGPDNRLAGQPDMTGNLGADYRFRGWPISIGGSVNWTPAYDIRLTAEQLERIRRKVVTDAYVLWHIDSATKLRLSVTATDPRDFQTNNIFVVGDERQSLVDTRKGYLVTALRLEMRL
jgi:iron complex outermembrane receptor protein